MDELITDHIQGLLADASHDVRLGRRLIALVGMLGGASIPDDISNEINLPNLFEQLDATRKQIAKHDSINYPLTIAWVVSQANSPKLLQKGR